MRKLFGYLVAAVFAGVSYILAQYGQQFSDLIDMVYPYVIRTLEMTLAQWSAQVDFLIWQLLAVAALVVIIASVIPVIALKKSLFSWFGWVLAFGSFVFMLHTIVYGMNYYAGDLADDLRMDVAGCSLQELVDATEYYRNHANSQAANAARDSSGSVRFEDFDTLANKAGTGFEQLTKQRFYPVFAGSTLPVKKLGWADMYTGMGITGFTFPLTGEAAVNPQIPDVSLPFTMCHEMAHRMCIANERDANFAAFLACSNSRDRQFQYSAYFMAYYYCYNALVTVADPNAAAAAKTINDGVNEYLRRDMTDYDNFFRSHRNKTTAEIADTVNDTYLKLSGEEEGIASYSAVCELLVNWYIQDVYMHTIEVIESQFDPYDEAMVDLTGIVNARG